MCRRAAYCILLSILIPSETRSDLIVQDYMPHLHDRFANDAAFIGNPYDWSGVGRLSGGGLWATMISPSYFVSATHFHPATSSTVRFHETNDFSGAFHDYTVVSGVQIAGSDLWLGRLSAAVDPSVAIYPLLDATDITGQTVFVYGQDGTTGMRLGRNIVDGVIPGFSDAALGASIGDIIYYDYDDPGGLGRDEAFVQGGDSGGPAFMIVDDQPAVVGIHWFNYVDTDPITGGVGSGDTFVSSYIAELSAGIGGESLTLVTVPEPTGPVLLVLVTLFALCCGGRRQQVNG